MLDENCLSILRYLSQFRLETLVPAEKVCQETGLPYEVLEHCARLLLKQGYVFVYEELGPKSIGDIGLTAEGHRYLMSLR